jgi:hypothetical protein
VVVRGIQLLSIIWEYVVKADPASSRLRPSASAAWCYDAAGSTGNAVERHTVGCRLPRLNLWKCIANSWLDAPKVIVMVLVNAINCLYQLISPSWGTRYINTWCGRRLPVRKQLQHYSLIASKTRLFGGDQFQWHREWSSRYQYANSNGSYSRLLLSACRHLDCCCI